MNTLVITSCELVMLHVYFYCFWVMDLTRQGNTSSLCMWYFCAFLAHALVPVTRNFNRHKACTCVYEVSPQCVCVCVCACDVLTLLFPSLYVLTDTVRACMHVWYVVFSMWCTYSLVSATLRSSAAMAASLVPSWACLAATSSLSADCMYVYKTYEFITANMQVYLCVC